MPAATIPGIATFHPREAWTEAGYPFTGLSARWDQITTNVAHYTADDDLIDGDPGEHAEDLVGYMRAMQRSYVKRRGYSLGYLHAIDWLGGVWECRGFDLRSAANVGDARKTGVKNFNRYSFPLLFLVDGADGLTDEAAHSARMLYREAERRAGRTLGRPVPHSHVEFTACCGDGIRAQISAGLLDPTDPPAPTPIPDPEEDDDMNPKPVALLHMEGTMAVYAQTSTGKWWVPDPATLDTLRYFYKLEVQEMPRSAVALMAASGPILGPVPPGIDGWGRPK